MLLGEIHFLSQGFPFLVMSSFSRVRCRFLVAWNVLKGFFSHFFCWCPFFDACFFCIVSGDYNQYFCAFLMYSSIFSLDASMLSWMLVSPLPSSFLDTYSLSLSSLLCMALCIVMSFLYSLVDLLEFLSLLLEKWSRVSYQATGQVFIPLKRLSLLFTSLEFFTSALANGFSLEFEWQQVSSSLLDSSQYCGSSQ